MRVRTLLAPAFLGLMAVSCGYSEEEWQAQLDKYNKLSQEHQSTEAKLAATKNELADAKKRVKDLSKQLEALGVDMSKLNESLQDKEAKMSKLAGTLAEQERALAEYKLRAKQLEAIKARFELLRKKLDELTKLGLNVNIRRNRMVISLPGDVLFESGKEKLKKEGEEVLEKLASVIRNDRSLLDRTYQVAGHTDDRAFSSAILKDNWGLSLMRAREVLMQLQKQGMPRDKWSAAGFGDTDPVGDNNTDEGRQKNRRCDVIVVPSVEEMLDLKEIAGT